MPASIVVRSCYAPQSGGGKYRRPVRLLVVVGEHKSCYRSNDPDILAEWRNLDSRYTGPRSEYGQALREAQQLVADVNANEAVTTPV